MNSEGNTKKKERQFEKYIKYLSKSYDLKQDDIEADIKGAYQKLVFEDFSKGVALEIAKEIVTIVYKFRNFGIEISPHNLTYLISIKKRKWADHEIERLNTYIKSNQNLLFKLSEGLDFWNKSAMNEKEFKELINEYLKELAGNLLEMIRIKDHIVYEIDRLIK